MDYRKATCLYHPNQTITNFCRDRNCLMPLCPSCIGDHTQYHQQNTTKPSYFNINQTFNNVQDSLYSTISCLQQDKRKNLQLIAKIKSVDALIQQKILSAKAFIFNSIDQAFVQLEIDLKKSLQQTNQQMGLFSLKKAKACDQNLSQTIQELYTIKSGLKSDNFLGSMIVFLKDMANITNTLHTRMINYLQSNQNYYPKLDFSNEAKNTIIYNVAKLIKIDSKRPSEKEKNTQLLRSLFKGKAYLSDNIDRTDKSYTPQKSFSFLKAADPLSSRSKISANKINNSPYRQRLQKLSTVEPSSNHHINHQIVNRKEYRRQYEQNDQRTHSIRRVQNY